MALTNRLTTKRKPPHAKVKWENLNSMSALSSGRGHLGSGFDAGQALATPYLPVEWADSEYRQAVLEAEVRHGVAWQIRVNREERGLKQSELATLMGTGQSAVSKLEDEQAGDVRLSTLFKAAHAFNCALLVKFVSYSDFAVATHDVRSERLVACSYDYDLVASRGRVTPLPVSLSALGSE